MKKIITMLVAFITATSLSTSAFASRSTLINIADNEKTDFNETVSLIVITDGDPLLASEQVATIGADYINTYQGKKYEQKLLKTQSDVMDSILYDSDIPAKHQYTYTSVLNGFSVEVPKDSVDEIRKLPNVKEVIETRPVQLYLGSSVNQANSLPVSTTDALKPNGYTGEGQVIAVIDSEFDLDHDFFNHSASNYALTEESIGEVLENNTMSMELSIDDVYISNKIPFAYDYANKDSDTSGSNIHGTHVAGIASGKNGAYPANTVFNGMSEITSFSGVAPESQLILMSVANIDGTLNTPAILAALDDSVKLGADVINLSLGSDYFSPATDRAYETIMQTIRNAGITVCAAAGNAGIGIDKTSSLTKHPDYSTLGTPAGYSDVTAVASVTNMYSLFNAHILTANDETEILYKNAYDTSTFSSVATGTMEYVDCGIGKLEDFEGKDLTGKIALVTRDGVVPFAEKSNNAKNANASLLLICNSDDSYINTSSLSLPAAVITNTDGNRLKSAEIKTVTFNGEQFNQLQTNALAGKMASSSGWGVNETLELKPEITAPGAYIYSSMPDNKYDTKSGTSMATPHISGVIALMSEYIDKHQLSLTGAERVTRIENLLMSTAQILKQSNGVPYSPRVQGAGLVNTASAMKTPVILIGNSSKSKISLGNNIGNTFTIKFTAQNLTDIDVTYDNIKVDILTDGYIEKDGEYYVTTNNSETLKFTTNDTLPSNVVVPANGTYNFEITVTLDETEINANKSIFTNGFFVDGFVSLAANTVDVPELSIPFTGFYGDWTSAPVLDKTMYDEGGSELYTYGINNGTALLTNFNSDYIKSCGQTINGEYDKNRIAISPDGDGYGDTLGIELANYRTTKGAKLSLIDSKSEAVATEEYNDIRIPKYWSSESIDQDDTYNEISFTESKLNALPDGTYTFKYETKFDYEGTKTESIELPVVIDRTVPEFTDVELEDNILTVTAKDNHQIDYITLYYFDDKGNLCEPKIEHIATNGGAETEVVFNVEGINLDNAVIMADDCAMNSAGIELKNALGTVMANLTEYNVKSGKTTAKFELTNTKAEDVKGYIIIALYNENGILINTALKENITLSAGMNKHTFELSEYKIATDIKLFIWDGFNKIKPLDTVKTFNISTE